MALPNIFNKEVTQSIIDRINKLEADTKPKWGKMSVSQMIAHLCVSYRMAFDDDYPKPGKVKRFLLKTFVKKAVTNEKPYRRSTQTAPEFVIKGSREFEEEKNCLISYIKEAQQLGDEHFHNKEYVSFGVMTKREWNNMFYKHLDHHLKQFGV